jgi:hypothetical protein
MCLQTEVDSMKEDSRDDNDDGYEEANVPSAGRQRWLAILQYYETPRDT